MRHFLKYLICTLVLTFAVQVVPCLASGAGGYNPPPQQQSQQVTSGGQPQSVTSGGTPQQGTGGQPQSVTSGGSGISIPLQNPLGNITIQQFFLKIIDIILIFAMPIIVLFIILAGFKYVTAQGNTEQIKSATTALTWALVGGVLILGAKAILTIIEGTVQALR